MTLDRGHGRAAGEVGAHAAGEDVAVPRRITVQGVGARWDGVALPGV